ncbi:hypothetical protein ACJIZ3_008342 [Penstemon smallii]|uniref:Purine permease 10 n=1 Tax=Penstemon smallii TaxID=265156 RepID=A0ABD3TAE8_9LAMI
MLTYTTTIFLYVPTLYKYSAMGEASELPPNMNGDGLQMAVYTFFVLSGQSVGTLLGRVYFNNGGNSKWMASLVQVVGFPILFPFQYITATTEQNHNEQNSNELFPRLLIAIYFCLGAFVAGNCMLYTIGLQYLPVTTFTLICVTQLGFNALFSFFLNAQKLTPYIINSIMLLTISSILLVFQTDSGESNKSSKRKFVIGFLCTLGASAGYALGLSLTQLAIHKVIKKESISAILDVAIYQSMVASFVIVIGLFISGEWKKLGKEMEGFELGNVSYVFSVGCVGLIFKVSSLFSNVINILGVPLTPILAAIFLHDKLTGLKAVSMVLAIWGFVSYAYQHYVDDLKMKKMKSSGEVSEVKKSKKQTHTPHRIQLILNNTKYGFKWQSIHLWLSLANLPRHFLEKSHLKFNRSIKVISKSSPCIFVHSFWHVSCVRMHVICSCQLGFNAFFSYFINSQKITPFILNSIVLLTISTTLLVLNSDSLTSNVNKNYTLGCICTLGGASGYALLLSVQQLAYGKLLKRQTFKEILNVILFESMVTTFALLVGLFGSGEWRSLRNEMEGFALGRKLYLVILIGSALAWQIFGIGMVALILKVSSLYANVVSTLNVPFVPVLGVLIFEDRMNGMKVVAMMLAVWGSVSYVYQKYVDDVEKVNVVQRD